MGAQEYADALLAAMRTGELVELPADLTEDEGYEIAGLIAKARQDAGDAIIGWKIGAAREDVQQMLGLTQPLVLPVHTSSLEPVRFGVLNKAAFEVECVHRVDARGAILASHVGIELMSLRTVGEMWGPWLVADQGVHTAAVVGDVMDVDEATIVLDAPGGVHMEGPFSRTVHAARAPGRPAGQRAGGQERGGRRPGLVRAAARPGRRPRAGGGDR